MFSSILTPRTANVFASSTTVNPELMITPERLEEIKAAATATFQSFELLPLGVGDLITSQKYVTSSVNIYPLPQRINNTNHFLTSFIVKPDEEESGFTVYAQVIVPGGGQEEYAVIDTSSLALAVRLGRQCARSIGAAYVHNKELPEAEPIVAI